MHKEMTELKGEMELERSVLINYLFCDRNVDVGFFEMFVILEMCLVFISGKIFRV